MHAAEAIAPPVSVEADPRVSAPTIDARNVTRSFGPRRALVDVSLAVASGEIHALLGPNGAGKTTLLRVLGGLMQPDGGSVRMLGADATRSTRAHRALIGLVPSGDRSFYLRISGFENLVFFARLHGLRRRAAKQRATEVLEAVGLAEDARRPAGEYSHGMQKRLSVARALLTEPRVLLVDEATHDLDPHAARVVRELVQRIAADGAAVVWATQRIDEIRGLAQDVTLLRAGEVVYTGSVVKLAARVRVTRHVLRLRSRSTLAAPSLFLLRRLLAPIATVVPATDDPELFVVTLNDDRILGDALATLSGAELDVLSCRELQSEIEEAFVQLTGAG
ncbi:MAG: ABC transporter ATP-binding protein [Gaiellaceae bacterium MAG52_C11]|nr:ABC transporter ATP-binding protein [Candidatus Gaiellasilicea maunaloa]